MSPPDGSRPAPPAKTAPSAASGPTEKPPVPVPAEPAAASPPPISPSAGRFAELLSGMAPLERIERLAVRETLSYGTMYEGRVFRASRAEMVGLLALDSSLEAGSAFPPIIKNLLAAARMSGSHLLTPRGLYRDDEDLYALYDALPGLSLATGFEYLQRNGLRLSSEAVLRVASGVLQALEELEREDAASSGPAGGRLRCHGMLIPENVWLTDDQRVLVRGIGIWQSEVSKTGRLGPRERRYLAPLQTSSGSPSTRSDLNSLGAILFEAAAGFPAFDSPPSEDDLAEIVVRIDEIGAKAEDARRELFGIAHACLSAMAVTPASRSRLRTTVDTMFLREVARERIPGCISLEELANRVKAARPAIVKAVALDLDPVDAPTARPAPAPAPEPRPAEAPAPSATPPSAPEPVAAPSWTLAPTPPAVPPKRRFEVHLSRAAAVRLAGGVAVVLLAFAVYWVSRPTPAVQPEETVASRPVRAPEPAPTPAAAPVEGTPAEASEVPTPDPAAQAAAEAAGQREAALAPAPSPPIASAPAPRPTAPPSRPQTLAARRAERRAGRSPGPAGGGSPVRPAPAAAAPRPAAPPPEDSSAPAVAPGTLVALSTPGLVPPAISERPEDPRLAPADGRPASPGTVQLSLLVDERGRVADHRILGASRFPPGLSSAVATYIGGLKFRAAELGGVPVKVWIRHDMRFVAP